MTTSEDSTRKRKREIPEEESTKMETELTSSGQFPEINVSELKVNK
jgi:hypothetical protein